MIEGLIILIVLLLQTAAWLVYAVLFVVVAVLAIVLSILATLIAVPFILWEELR